MSLLILLAVLACSIIICKAVALATVLTYFILITCHLKYALIITVFFFLVRFTISVVRYHKNKEDVLEKLKKSLSE